MDVARVVGRWRAAHAVRILIDRDATNEARAKYTSLPNQIVGTFDSSAAMYRIFDGEELVRILKTGTISGGVYAVKAERAHGASWGSNITEVIEVGNRILRGKRYGNDLFLAKLDTIGVRFHHLDPKVPFDPNGAPEQPATMDTAVCNFGLGCSMNVGLNDVDLFVVHPDDHIESITKEQAKSYVDARPVRDVDLREINSQFFVGSILGHDVQVRLDHGTWKVILVDGERRIVDDAPTKDDAVEVAKIGIKLNPNKPIRMPHEVLLRKRKYEKHFEQDEDPDKKRGDYALRPKDKVTVEKGSRNLGIDTRSTAVVADVYQREGDRTVNVKLMFGDKPVTLYAMHPNRLGDREIALMNSSGSRILVRKKASVNRLTLKVAARFAALQVGYGPAGTGLTYQEDFPPTTECQECGEDARIALVVKEPANEESHVADLYKHGQNDEAWPEGSTAFAIYLCPDADCGEATTLWNQA